MRGWGRTLAFSRWKNVKTTYLAPLAQTAGRSINGAMMSDTARSADCPACRAAMTHVAATPHPVVPTMQRSTFVCYRCNQTRTYMLPAEAGAK
jgi:hypothetical protein